MSIPLAIFLYIYLAIALVIGIFTLLVLVQAIRFGMKTASSYVVSLMFVGAMFVVLMFTFVSLSGVDWSSTFSISVPNISTTPEST